MFRTQLWLARQRLKSKSPQARVRAVRQLRQLGDEPAVAALVDALQDSESEVRKEAALALGESQDESALNPLVAALRDPAEAVQGAAIQALKRLGHSAAVGPLAAALDRLTPQGQWLAAQALAALGWKPANTDQEIQFLIAAGDFRGAAQLGPAAIRPLTAVLRSSSYQERVMAANLLGEMGDPSVFKPLLGALKDNDALVRAAAACALARLGNPEALPGLITALKDRDKNVRLAAATTLGQLHDARAVEPLIQALNDPDWEVKTAIVESLGRLGDARAAQPVTACLEDHDQQVRQHAVDALGQMGDTTIIEKLVFTLVDEHTGVRQAAARTLGRLDPDWEKSDRVQRLLPTLQEAAKHKDSTAQYAAMRLVQRIRDQSVEEPKLAIAHGDAQAKQQTAVRILEELLQDEDAEVRLAAAESLARLQAAATPPQPAEDGPRPASDEMLICSAQGEVLYQWQCRNLDAWIRLIEFVSQKAQRLVQGLVLGEFNRLVIQNPDSRAVILISADRGVLVHTRTQPPRHPPFSTPARMNRAGNQSP